MPKLELFDLEPSPNNIKVRLALGWKGVPYDRVAVDPRNRSALIEATGQELTPAIRHGEVTLFDSHAILRYIDCNFRGQGGRLYPLEREPMRAVELWEHRAWELQACVGTIFGQFFASAPDVEVCREVSRRLDQETRAIEEALAGRDFLLGSEPCAADFVLAPMVWYGCLTDEEAARDPLRGFFKAHLVLGEGRDATRDWVRRCMAFDR